MNKDTAVETPKPYSQAELAKGHKPAPALAAFRDAQKQGTVATAETVIVADAVVPVVDEVPQVKRVTVRCLDNGSFRIGNLWYALSKGKNAVLPEDVAAQFRKNKLIE